MQPHPTLADWQAAVEKDLKGTSAARLITRLPGGITLPPLATAADETPPTALPRTRPGAPALCTEVAWPEVSGAAALIEEEIEGGAQAVLLRVGAEAVPAWTVEDMRELCDAARPGRIHLSGGLAAAALLAAAQEEDARGSFGLDPIGRLAREGRLGSNLADALVQCADFACWAARERPGMRVMVVDGAAIHGAGASGVRDLACMVATGISYLRALTGQGMDLESAVAAVGFRVSLGTHFFEEIARLRALRLLWGRVLEIAGDPEAARGMHITAGLGDRHLSRVDPKVNLLRNTAAAFAATLGGADTVLSRPFDAALGQPGNLGRRIARNTPIILHEEAHLARTFDPAAGAWSLEQLTHKLAAAAWTEIQALEAAGGIGASLEGGHLQAAVDLELVELLARVDRRQDPLVGVSEFPLANEEEVEVDLPDPPSLPLVGVPPALPRPDGAGSRAAALVAAAAEGMNLRTLQAGLQGPDPARALPMPLHRLAAEFEDLRRFVEEAVPRPRVALLCLGPKAEHGPRASWTRNLLEAGGFEVVQSEPLNTTEEVQAVLGLAPIAALVGTDAAYAALQGPIPVPVLALAGRPSPEREALGVRHFLFAGCDARAALARLARELIS